MHTTASDLPTSDDSVLPQITAALAAAGVAGADDEAQRLAAAVLGRADAEATPDQRAHLLALAARRAAGEPLARVLGRAEFLGLSLALPPGVLAPREETELLAREALATLDLVAPPSAARPDAPAVLDLCCGSGNLALALARNAPRARVWASDLTDPCVDTARRNAQALGLAERVQVRRGDLFAALAGEGLEGALDLIVCNPPYISTGRLAGDRAGLLAYEPREAFDGGPYGLSLHQRVVAGAPAFLRPGGALLMEFGEGQARQIGLLFERARSYEPVRFARDGRGVERVAVARRK